MRNEISKEHTRAGGGQNEGQINRQKDKTPKTLTGLHYPFNFLLTRDQQSLLLIMKNRLNAANHNHSPDNRHPNEAALGGGDEYT